MSKRNEGATDLHGNVPDVARLALLLVDVINDLSFPGNAQLIRQAAKLGSEILELKQRCRRAGIPAIYINDNSGKWRSDIRSVVAHSLRAPASHRALTEQLLPQPDDYVVLKPKHSAFYATPLDALLEYMNTKSVILTGVTSHSCILLTAAELYIRDLKVYVPQNCVAGLTPRQHRTALRVMEDSFGVKLCDSKRLNLRRIAEGKA
jgi:nicotinamidase-related amidase